MVQVGSILNIQSGSRDWRANILSNFPNSPFELDDVLLVSVEGFIQGIKFPENDPRREEAFKLWGSDAKKYGPQAAQSYGYDFVYWGGKKYFYGTDEHHALIERAIRARFLHNQGAFMALLKTKGMRLVHEVGPESVHTSLPAKVFCRILTEIRDNGL